MSYYPNYQMYSYPAFNGHFQTHQGFMYGHGAPDPWRSSQPSGHRTTETKPRLAKEEVEQLEAVFQKNHKPNSSVKKGLAEQMRVDIARINNWFQNRRAKAKHEARQKQEQASEPSSPDAAADKSQGEEAAVPQVQFAPVESSPVAQSPSLEIPSPRIDALNQPLDVSRCEDMAGYTSPEPVAFHHAESQFSFPTVHSTFLPAQFQELSETHDSIGHAQPAPESIPMGLPLTITTTIESSAGNLLAFASLGSSSDGLDGPLPAFPSQLLPGTASPVEIKLEGQSPQELCGDLPRYQDFSPEPLQHSPAVTPNVSFRAPPPVVDLASRRNMRRPAPLGPNALRACSFGGPKTGMDLPKRSEAASPMRRIASAGLNMGGRIAKPMSAAPRSPMYMDKRPEALLQLVRSPSIGAPQPQSALPPTPITPIVAHQQCLREATVSSTSSEDERRPAAYSYQPASFVLDPSIGTPPATPGLISGFPEALFPNPLEAAYNFSVADEPLTTPLLSTFGTEPEPAFSTVPDGLPSYITSAAVSQPSTPSYPPTTMGPTYFTLFPGNNQEYNWSDAVSTRSSPIQTQPVKSRQLQFTNITPQDFQR